MDVHKLRAKYGEWWRAYAAHPRLMTIVDFILKLKPTYQKTEQAQIWTITIRRTLWVVIIWDPEFWAWYVTAHKYWAEFSLGPVSFYIWRL